MAWPPTRRLFKRLPWFTLKCSEPVQGKARVADRRSDLQGREDGLIGTRNAAMRWLAALQPWMAAATMMEMPNDIAATTSASATFCFSTISCHRS